MHVSAALTRIVLFFNEKGTPSMREGVHCVGRDDVVVTDSDESDRGLPDLDADAVERAGTIRARKWRKSASNAAAE